MLKLKDLPLLQMDVAGVISLKREFYQFFFIVR